MRSARRRDTAHLPAPLPRKQCRHSARRTRYSRLHQSRHLRLWRSDPVSARGLGRPLWRELLTGSGLCPEAERCSVFGEYQQVSNFVADRKSEVRDVGNILSSFTIDWRVYTDRLLAALEEVSCHRQDGIARVDFDGDYTVNHFRAVDANADHLIAEG